MSFKLLVNTLLADYAAATTGAVTFQVSSFSDAQLSLAGGTRCVFQ